MESRPRPPSLPRCIAPALFPSITDLPCNETYMDQHREDSSQHRLSIILPASKPYSPKFCLTPSHSSASQKKK